MKFHFGLIGYQLGQSLSPMIHNLAFEALGLHGEYRLYPLPSSAEGIKGLELLLRNMRQGQIQGLNVTIPHKQTVIDYLDDLTPIARTIGAVNTILWDRDQLIGDNTDAEGFWVDLAGLVKNKPKTLGSQALILGAGGAARAVAYALLAHGWRVWVAARRFEQAHTLVRDLYEGESNLRKTRPEIASFRPDTSTGGLIATSISELPDMQSAIRNIRLIINTTPVGKYPDIEDTPWPTGLSFPDNVCAYDLVYNPPETRFLQQARQTGCIVRSGKGMLVEQALLSFERWTKKVPPREKILRSMDISS